MTAKIRKTIYEKYDGHCAYCGRKIKIEEMQIDHFRPKNAGGDDDLENLMPSCRRCNHYKRAHPLELFRAFLLDMRHKVIDDTYLGKIALDYGMVEWKGWDGKFYFEKQGKEVKGCSQY